MKFPWFHRNISPAPAPASSLTEGVMPSANVIQANTSDQPPIMAAMGTANDRPTNAAQPEAQEPQMSVDSTIAAVETDITTFWSKIKTDVVKAKAVWAIISSTQTRAAMIAVFNAAVATIAAGANAAEAGATNVTLDSAVVADINVLIASVKAGDGVIASDFKAIGIALK